MPGNDDVRAGGYAIMIVAQPMTSPPEASLVRVYCNANEKWHGRPLYRAIVETARQARLAGASVFPIELGFGAHRRVHDITSDYTSFEIPIVVEVVDAAERVARFLGELETMIAEGLVVVSSARVIRLPQAAEPEGALRAISLAIPPSPPRRISGEEVTSHMKLEGDGKRVTVYVGSADSWHGRNLAIAIVERCRELGMAGATVSRGVMGFGKHSVIHKAHMLGLSDDLPEKIEVVDQTEEIDRLLPALEEMMGAGLIVVEDVHIVRYRH
jgi:PII-like signaling protein